MEIKVGDYTFKTGLYKLQGYNGTGKTTLLTAIFLGNDFLKREILFDGKNVKDLSKKEFSKIQSKMIYIKSSGNLLKNMTVEENLLYVSKNVEVNEIPFKNKLTTSLSGGEEELVASLLYNLPEKEIVLLDEVSNFLDEKNLKVVIGRIEKAAKDKIVIVATHDDRVVLDNAVVYDLNNNKTNFWTIKNTIIKVFFNACKLK